MESVRDYAVFMPTWTHGTQLERRCGSTQGYTGAEIIGRHFSAFYTPEDQVEGKPAAELRAAKANGRIEDEGWRMRRTARCSGPTSSSPPFTGAAATDRLCQGTRDMTERHRLEKLERSSRRMSEFLAMLAHELRNPLAPIRNAVTVMQLETLTAGLAQLPRHHRPQLTHMTRLVDDLLDVGRLTTGKIKLRRKCCAWAKSSARSVETARPMIEARAIR